MEPDNPVFQKNLADFYCIVRGDVQAALEIYVGLLAKDPADMETLLALGQICMEQDKFDDAAVFFQRILEIDPGNSDATRQLNAVSGSAEHAARQSHGDSAAILPSSSKSYSSREFPSPIIKTEIIAEDRRYVVQIPQQEVFRIKNIFAQKEYAVMEKRRGSGDFVVFDVGANVGLFALSVHAVHPQSRIHCFEPCPAVHMLLEANVGDFPEMIIHKFGLFNRDMEAAMHIHQYNTGQNSIRFAGTHHSGTVHVQVRDAGTQFDALGLAHLDVLKIDTEGCEVEILESMGDRLDKVDYVLAEYHTEGDRRAIDELLNRFHLFGSSAVTAGVGTVKYVHRTLV